MADYDPERPFTTADAGESSRVAQSVREAMAKARRDKSRPQLPSKSTVQTGGLRQMYSGAAAFAQGLETRMAAHPAFILDAERGTLSIARLRLVIVAQAAVMILLAAMLAASLDQKNDSGVYAATDTKGQARYLTGLMAPTYTQAAVLSWAGAQVANIMNFGFHNVTERLQENRAQFTDRGWKAFATAIDKSQLMQKIVTKEQVVTAAPIGAPVIVHMEDRPDKSKSWLIQLPIMVTVLSGKQTEANRRILTLEIVTVPPAHNLTGLGINNWIEG